MTRTTLQSLTEAAEQALALAPEVKSIVLYGSRARGDARPDSDWDIAIFTEEDKRKAYPAFPAFDSLNNVDPKALTLSEMSACCDQPTTIFPAILTQGRRLAGRWNPRPWLDKEIRMKPDVLCREIHAMTETIRNSVVSDAGAIHLHKEEGHPRYNRSAVRNSVRAAELMAKLVLSSHEEIARKVHDMNALAEQLEQSRSTISSPDEKQRFADRIRELDGNARIANQAEYLDELEPPERTSRRNEDTIRLQQTWLAWYVKKNPQTEDTLRRLKTSLRFFASEIQEHKFFPLLPRSTRDAVHLWSKCGFADDAPGEHPGTDTE